MSQAGGERVHPKEMYSPEEEFAQMTERHLDEGSDTSIVLDLDETMFNTVAYWVQVYNDVLRTRFGIAEDALPTAEAVYAAGGTDNVYKGYYPDEETFMSEAELLRGTWMNNLLPAQMESELGSKFDSTFTPEKRRRVIGSITARPGTGRVIRATRLQFRKHKVSTVAHALHEMPIIGRPDSVDIKFTTGWKIEKLEKLQAENPRKLLVIVDDSLSLAKGIAERNKHRRPDQLPLIQVVYPGPNTAPKILSGEFVADPDNGIYISNWETMDARLKEIEDQWKITRN